jgi:glycerol-3-phosphate dehydrogenase (NAD(P)+)
VPSPANTSNSSEGRAAGQTVAVLGGGSWGTALAIQFARAGHPTRIWSRSAVDAAAMRADRQNRRYLPDARFPDNVEVLDDLGAAVTGAAAIIVAVPSHALRALLQQLKPLLARDARLAWATKGFELDTGKLPHQVAYDVLGDRYPVAVLSGPTFAREVGMGLPTAMTIASPDGDFAAQLAKSLHASNFRAYTSTDIVGVEVGGAVKNVLAVGAGLSDGLGFGANTRIALITRGLTEVMRLGVALGAQPETFMGLAGLGDLVLTSTDNQSRNRRFGLALAAGQTVEAALQSIGQVVEGYAAARAVHAVAMREKVDMPIAHAIYRILYEGAPARDVVKDLMTRPIRAEVE